MLGKLLSDTVAVVKSKTDEFQANVRLQATRAVNEVLGLPNRSLTARELQQHLEREAAYHHTVPSICDMYLRWIQQIVESGKGRVLFADELSPRSVTLGQRSGESTPRRKPKLSVDDKKVETVTDKGEEGVKGENEDEEEFKSPRDVPPNQPIENTDDVVPPLIDLLSEPQIRNLTFKQALLRSNALEISLATVAQLPDVRNALAGPAEEEEDESPRALVQRLLQLCLRGDGKLHLELLFLFCTADATADDRHLLFLTELVSILKINWRDDYLYESRRHIATEIERVKFDINHSANLPNGEEEIGGGAENLDHMTILAKADKHDTRVSLSLHLLNLYKETMDNLKKSASCRKDHHKKTIIRIHAVMEKVGGSEKDYKAACNGASGRTNSLHEQMLKAGEDLVAKMMALEKNRDGIEVQISELESERRILILKVDELSTKISGLEDLLRDSVDLTNESRQELESVRRKFRTKIATEESMKSHSETRQQDLQNIQTVTSQTELQLDSILKALEEDALTKCQKIFKPSKDLLAKHLQYEKSRLSHHRHVVVYFARQVSRLNSDISNCQGALQDVNRNSIRSDGQTQQSDKGNGGEDREIETDGFTVDVYKTNMTRLRYLMKLNLEARHRLARAFAQLEEIGANVEKFRNHPLCKMRRMESDDTGDITGISGSNNTTNDGIIEEDVENEFKEIEKLYREIKHEVVEPHIALLETRHAEHPEDLRQHQIAPPTDAKSTSTAGTSTAGTSTAGTSSAGTSAAGTSTTGTSATSTSASGDVTTGTADKQSDDSDKNK